MLKWLYRVVPEDKVYVLWAIFAAGFIFAAGIHLATRQITYMGYDLVVAALGVYLTWIHYTYVVGDFDDDPERDGLPELVDSNDCYVYRRAPQKVVPFKRTGT